MTYTIDKVSKDKLVDLHINNLNNIQKIVDRLSKIGYTLISISMTIWSIMFPLIYSLNVEQIIRIVLVVTLFFSNLAFFVSFLINLRNEKIWRKIYDQKIKLDLENLNKKNKFEEILSFDFEKEKRGKVVTLYSCCKSWLSICWFIVFASEIISLFIVIFCF